MSTRPRATAVVVTHDSADQIDDCLIALLAGGLPVLVVDNASRDDTLRRLRAHPEVAVLANPVNTGFAAAVNTAWRALDHRAGPADHDHPGCPGLSDGPDDDHVLLLVNPDCVVPASTVRALVGALAADPGALVAGPALTDRYGRPAPGARRFESLATVVASRFGGALLPRGLRRRLSGAPAGDPARPIDVDWLCGACLAVRVGLLRRTGGLDERYFLYYEDEDLCRRAHQLGGRVLFLAGVAARHIGGASSRPGETWPYLYRSMIDYFAAHHPGQVTAIRGVVGSRAVLGLGLARLRQLTGRPHHALRTAAWRAVLELARSGPETPYRVPASPAGVRP